MAYDIGPRISLKGDAEFRSAINSANASLKEYGSELKVVNAEIEANGKSHEALQKKSELLQKQFEAQTGKLNAYREAIEKQQKIQAEQKKTVEELTKEFGENSAEVKKAQKEYDATTANIQKLSQGANETQAYITKLTKEIKDCAEETNKFGSNLTKVADKATELGTSLSKNVTAPIVAVGTASVVAFNDFDKAMDIVIQKTGASGEKLEEFEGIVKNIASEVPSDFDTIASAVGEVNTRFGLTGDELDALSEQFVKFAELNNTDVSTAIDEVQKSLSAFGLSTDEASHLLDVMNAVGQSTGISMDTLTNGLIQNATAFQEMGLSLEQSVLLMGQIEMSGADTNTVLTGLSKALRTATADGKSMDEALAEMENAILNGADGVDGLTIAYDLFGRKGDEVYNAIKNGSLSFQDLANMAIEADGSVTETFNNTMDGAQQFELAMQNVKLAGAELGEQIMGVLAPILQSLTATIQGVTQWFSGLDDGTKKMIVTIGGIVASIGPLLVIFGKVAMGINSIMTLAKTLNITMNASLLGPIGIITLVIAGLVLLYTKCEWFRDAVNAIWQAVVDFFVTSWNVIVEFFTVTLPNVFNTVINFVSDNWQGLLLLLLNPFVGAFKLIYDNCDGFRNFINNLVNDVINFFTQLPEKATKWGKDMIDNFINGITSKVSKLWDSIKDIGQGIADFLGFSVPKKGPLSKADTWMPDMINLMSEGIESQKGKLVDSVRSLANDMEMNPTISGSAMITGTNTINLNVVGQVNGKAVMSIVDNIALSNLNGMNVARGM